MKATLIFSDRSKAEQFAAAWSRFTFRGYTIGAGMENVPVNIYGITDHEKIWVEDYVSETNLINNLKP